jgi:hypothetical protein
MFCNVFLRFVILMFWIYYVLKLLRLETITFSDATLSDINVMLCYISQYLLRTSFYVVGTATVTKSPQYRLELLPAPLPNSTLPFSLGITELLMHCCKHKKLLIYAVVNINLLATI